MPPLPVVIAPPKLPQTTRYAIQKARGRGWKTLEVGQELPATQARFQAMTEVNPRAYFRLIQLDPLPGTTETEHEFGWKLIELFDPTQNPGGRGNDGADGDASSSFQDGEPARRRTRRPGSRRRPRPAATRSIRPARERVAIPVRFYLIMILFGVLIGAALYLHYARR